MSPFDHVFVALFVVAYPLAGAAGFRRLLKRMAAGWALDRRQIYRNTLIGHWLLLVVALSIWVGAGRPWAALGLGFSADWRFLAGLVAVLVAVCLLLLQVRQARRADGDALGRMRRQFGRLAAIVPRDRAELLRFYAVSITAGVVEEVLWRGFLIWYLAQFCTAGMAALVAALAFGIAHAYQGWRQVPIIIAVAALLTALYLLTGTLWLSILMHIAIDVLQGSLAFEIQRRHLDLRGTAARS